MTAIKNLIRAIGCFFITNIPFLNKIVSVGIKVKFGVKLTGDEYKEYTLHGIFPKLYRKCAKAPVDENKVVFIEVRHPQVTNSYQLLVDRLIKDYNYDVHFHFLRNPFAPRDENILRCNEMIADIATAKYIFIDDGSNALACLPLREETVVTQLWHGCGAFKKFGFSTAELLFGNSREEMLRFPNHADYTYVTVSSPEVVWAYEEAFGLEGKNSVIPIGCSRTDIFYDKQFIEKAREKLKRIMPSSEGKKVILYAPTFRGRVKKAAAPKLLDIAMFAEALSDEYVFIYKHHPLVKNTPPIPAPYAQFARDFTDAMSIEELLCVSDICISDYSSLIFEYSLFEKPMIFYAYDISEYFDWRGFYYDYDELAPGPVFKSNIEMIDYIKHIDERFDVERVRQFRKKFMSACDGHATDRLLEKVFGEGLSSHLRDERSRLELEYHLVPNSDLLPSEKAGLIREIKSEKESIRAAYSAACRVPVRPDKVVYIGNEPTVGATLLLEKLRAGSGLKITEIPADTDEKEIAVSIADARFIILDGECRVTDFVKLRPESEIIQLWKYSIPVERFGFTSVEAQSGLEKDYFKALSPYKNYGFVPAASDYAATAFAKCFGCGRDTVRKIGSVHTDIFFNEQRKKLIRERINELYPSAEGKKIIFYYPRPRTDITVRPNVPVFVDIQKMYEVLKDEYVLICEYPNSQTTKMPRIKFFSEFICNIDSELPGNDTGEEVVLPDYSLLTVSEIIAAADVVIGDYNSEILDFAVSGKPILFYAPDATAINSVNNALTDYFELTDGLRFYDTPSMIEQLKNPESYDYNRLNALREKYFGQCDGKAHERIAEYILSNINHPQKEAVTV